MTQPAKNSSDTNSMPSDIHRAAREAAKDHARRTRSQNFRALIVSRCIPDEDGSPTEQALHLLVTELVAAGYNIDLIAADVGRMPAYFSRYGMAIRMRIKGEPAAILGEVHRNAYSIVLVDSAYREAASRYRDRLPKGVIFETTSLADEERATWNERPVAASGGDVELAYGDKIAFVPDGWSLVVFAPQKFEAAAKDLGADRVVLIEAPTPQCEDEAAAAADGDSRSLILYAEATARGRGFAEWFVQSCWPLIVGVYPLTRLRIFGSSDLADAIASVPCAEWVGRHSLRDALEAGDHAAGIVHAAAARTALPVSPAISASCLPRLAVAAQPFVDNGATGGASAVSGSKATVAACLRMLEHAENAALLEAGSAADRTSLADLLAMSRRGPLARMRSFFRSASASRTDDLFALLCRDGSAEPGPGGSETNLVRQRWMIGPRAHSAVPELILKPDSQDYPFSALQTGRSDADLLGWYGPEGAGRWTRDRHAFVRLISRPRLDTKRGSSKYALRVSAAPARSSESLNLHLRLNGVQIASPALPRDHSVTTIEFQINPKHCSQTDLIEIECEELRRPAGSEDCRRLGVYVHSISNV